MIIKFDNFINEFYKGPYSSAGFKLHEPSDKFNFKIYLQYKPENEEILKTILSKYDIAYDNLDLHKTEMEGGDEDEAQKLDLTFLSYNELEAGSIINSILIDLNENGILFDPSTINVQALNKTPRKRIGFRMPKEEIED